MPESDSAGNDGATATETVNVEGKQDNAAAGAATTPASSPRDGSEDDVQNTRGRQSLPRQLSRPKLLTPRASGLSVKAQGTTATSVSTDVYGSSSIANSPTGSRAQSRRPSFVNSFRGSSLLDDNASVRSLLSRTPSIQGDLNNAGNLLGLGSPLYDEDVFEEPAEDEDTGLVAEAEQRFANEFRSEFVDLSKMEQSGVSDKELSLAFSLKLKHYLILTSAGKPIYSRHGSDAFIAEAVGVIQTIISSFEHGVEGDPDALQSFTAGDARFAIMSKGHLHLVAVSRLRQETDAQLYAQLEAMYMQILSTLTLPTMERMFLNRPSTDLRRPLQGTEKLISALADGFTRGSPSVLLGALESLKLRKAHRQAINSILARSKTPGLLYALVVAGGRLISVLRPRKHSLHPSDLQLMFNMLFEAGGVRAGGDESWIPLCLPGFNNTGYVHMYVSFVPIPVAKEGEPVDRRDALRRDETPQRSVSPAQRTSHPSRDEPLQEITILLITAQKDSLDDLKTMRQSMLSHLDVSKVRPALYAAVAAPRTPILDLFPGTPLRHFLLKSRTHVQFVMPAAGPHYADSVAWRLLMCTYASLQGAAHGGGARGRGASHAGNTRVQLRVEATHLAICCIVPEWEVYAVAARGARRDAVLRGVERVIVWAKQEEQRLFVIGGAVF